MKNITSKGLVELSPEEQAQAQAVIDGTTHEVVPPYVNQRLLKYPEVGDQLDAVHKARQKRRMLLGKAQKALEAGDTEGWQSNVMSALDTTEEEDAIDGVISSIKREVPKDWQPEEIK